MLNGLNIYLIMFIDNLCLGKLLLFSIFMYKLGDN